MAVKNSYVDSAGQPAIDKKSCTYCKLCIKICPSFTLVEGDGAVAVNPDTEFGCIGCLQCAAACPTHSVMVSGRAIRPDDLIELPGESDLPDCAQLGALMTARRSIRRFADREVEQEVLDKVIELASTAPMGIPPSDVRLLVFNTRKKVRELATDNLESMKKSLGGMKLFASPLGALMMGKQAAEVFASFVIPLARTLVAEWDEGRDKLLYDAPAALYFHGTPWIDPVDVGIAATYAMLAAESQGLGTCLVGSVHPFMNRNKQLCAKYGIPATHKHGIVLIMGYPRYKFSHAVRRRFGEVRHWQE